MAVQDLTPVALESYAGVHDFLNSWFFYDENGNNHRWWDQSVALSAVGTVINWGNVAVATPFVAGSLVAPYQNWIWGGLNGD